MISCKLFEENHLEILSSSKKYLLGKCMLTLTVQIISILREGGKKNHSQQDLKMNYYYMRQSQAEKLVPK